MNRREFLRRTMLGIPALMCLKPHELFACLPENDETGQLSFHNQQTKEFLDVQYIGANGSIDPLACERLNQLFRCVYTGEVLAIDSRLFVLLDAIRCRLSACEHPYILLSGYRSPDYNSLLRQQNPRVGQNSFHTLGMAADIRIAGAHPREIAEAAKSFQAGGVGKYSDFVHVDVGPIRYWS